MERVVTEAFTSRAAGVLAGTAGQPVSLSVPRVLKDTGRSLTLRYRTSPALSGSGSVIVKQIRGEAERGYSDWAGLDYLSRLADTGPFAPRFLGGDVAAGLYVMADLGDGQTLQDLLTTGNPREVAAALELLAVRMADLHAATRSGEETYGALRAGLPGSQRLGREREAEAWLAGAARIEGWFAAVDRQPPDLTGCLQVVAQTYCHPGDFLSFTHGDPAPTNNFFAEGGALLLDFEYGAFRHALYDVTAWEVLCPLPTELLGRMRRSFQARLARTLAAAGDEAVFSRAWAHLCAYRALAILSWIPPSVVQANRPWASNWTMREAVLVALTRLHGACAAHAPLGPLRRAAQVLLAELRARWPEFGDAAAVLPPWPALRQA